MVRGAACCALALAACQAIEAQAQLNAPNLPDAGQILRELRQPAPESQTPAAPERQQPETSPAPRKARDIQVTITSFDISGNVAIPGDELQALLFDLRGKRLGLAELNEAAERITRLYHERGYTVARAYLPAQDVKEGKIAIMVLEGRIDQREMRNASRLSNERAAAYLEQATGGGVIRGKEVDRGLLLLSDTPGVGAARAALQPGASVGTSDLLVELDPGAAVAGNVSLDNFGNRYTGQTRLAGSLQVNSPLHIGDQATITALSSGANLSYGRLAYQVPVGADGLRLGAAFAATRYRLGREYAPLDAHGRASSFSVFGLYPVIRSQAANLYASATLEQKRLSDIVQATSTATDKRIRVASLGLAGSYQDSLGGGGISSFDTALAFGRLDIESPAALAIDAISARTRGSYARLTISANRMQRITDRDYLWLLFSGQWASKNLDSSEKFALGGASGVRAYPQGEGIGDEGYLASVEWRHNISSSLQGTLFYDAGTVSINRNPFDAAAANRRTLSGTGLGLNLVAGGVDIRVSLAWRASGGPPTSVPAGSSRSPTLWVRANVPF